MDLKVSKKRLVSSTNQWSLAALWGCTKGVLFAFLNPVIRRIKRNINAPYHRTSQGLSREYTFFDVIACPVCTC